MTLGDDDVGQAADVQAGTGQHGEGATGRSAAPAGHAPRGRLPDFFIAGHAKCGTTALYFMLKSHPEIYMPVKEPRYFAPELRTRFWRPASSHRDRPRTLEGYRSLFAAARPEQRIGEATPSYLRSATAAGRIAEVQPDARVIAILREPASFLRSFHLQLVRNYDETQKSLRKAIMLEDARRRGKRIPRFSQAPSGLLYSDHVRYVEQLRRYHTAFGAEQVLVLIYDDFRADNEATVRQVMRFLDVDDRAPVPPVEFETLRAPRSQLLDQLTRGVAIARRSRQKASGGPRAAGPRAQTGVPGAEQLGALWRRALYTENPAPDEELMLELRRRFKPEVEAVSEYLDRDLVTLWGYDRIG